MPFLSFINFFKKLKQNSYKTQGLSKDKDKTVEKDVNQDNFYNLPYSKLFLEH